MYMQSIGGVFERGRVQLAGGREFEGALIPVINTS